ncbi:MAG: gamma-glutamyl-gamma-aminobutyrate hydrolase family protein [Phenylobacterium sp.]|jgi:putative glutamine amidotransferase|uniref:gamma-glutamyl-gamma-aminobutyrate hydrolase family protein n=1 Tax=Phenylobacterium sp. TaxID=1871053 RepID=UPI0025E1087E|nr:gamma-glutamyl-gamma-aminobutyrate hydrolase family protein [Phenylobacterium sp.]MCA3711014.1 gamma-glutamyl-gamma-aminobutyrate hydrolase family protein [Phenylobacterium sp.]MCA3716065.1 gamma-glutamyl-gamma-aminobutyrate hydrolase family protein [Phenylobacterium sp.]MCA3729580.1 gamma-glutamyl-gamma-aminobutyrate hydrolase family protein [Phenylobacterium sp.]MCA3731677.1 gamma-glutamyl-gamma-aminobutyrate hydrolase family protein [Phenylobacterium sp.]MCA3735801.1 gamma-glutamyl-gamma
MARPVAGIICCTRTVGIEPAQAVMNRYVASAMAYADAAALLVPSMPGLMRAADVASRLDGLLLTGSPSNLDPGAYGEAADDAPGPFDPARDAMTGDLIRAMLDLGRPVFGICRGFQELNVAFGGTLRRDVSENPDLLRHHAPDEVGFNEMFDHVHDVELTPGGVLADALGQARIRVNSVHYQGVQRLGEGLSVEAQADDGVVEAFSTRVNTAPVLAVQWHPEWRTGENPQSQVFFGIFGRALRGEPLVS